MQQVRDLSRMADCPSHEYKYRPLAEGEFRVLVLLPEDYGDPGGPLRARLVHTVAPLNKLRYEALSYVWGNQREPETLRVMYDADSAAFGTIQIGRNLASALRGLRRRSGRFRRQKIRTIWCDAVCINQNDLAERADQVKRMGSIFRGARRVVFWLGPGNEDISSGMEVLRNVETSRLPLSDAAWKHLNSLLSLPWFSRLWIRQEVALSDDSSIFMSGTDRDVLNWPTFQFSVAYLREVATMQPTSYESSQAHFRQNLERAYEVLRCRKDGNIIMSLFVNTRHCLCTDQRDRVYGIMGIQEELRLEPDYTESKSTRDVYFDLAVAHMRSCSISNICYLCEMADGPSWVPDFRTPVPLLAIDAPGFASGRTEAICSISSEKSLRILATHCGTIAQRTTSMPSDPSLEVAQLTLASWKFDAFPRGIKDCDGPVVDDWVATIAHGRLLEDYDRFNSVATSKAKECLLMGTEGYSPEYLDEFLIWDDASRVASGLALLTTESGKFALGTGKAREGDEVFVLLGCDLLMILRYIGDLKYRIVGPCFMHSLMRVEALLGPLPEGWRMVYYLPNGALGFIKLDGESTLDDPRLEILPPDWKQIVDIAGLL